MTVYRSRRRTRDCSASFGAAVADDARYNRYRSEFESLGAYAVVDDQQQVGRQLAEQVREHLPAEQEAAAARDTGSLTHT